MTRTKNNRTEYMKNYMRNYRKKDTKITKKNDRQRKKKKLANMNEEQKTQLRAKDTLRKQNQRKHLSEDTKNKIRAADRERKKKSYAKLGPRKKAKLQQKSKRAMITKRKQQPQKVIKSFCSILKSINWDKELSAKNMTSSQFQGRSSLDEYKLKPSKKLQKYIEMQQKHDLHFIGLIKLTEHSADRRVVETVLINNQRVKVPNCCKPTHNRKFFVDQIFDFNIALYIRKAYTFFHMNSSFKNLERKHAYHAVQYVGYGKDKRRSNLINIRQYRHDSYFQFY